MIDLDDLIEAEIANGYGDENAKAKVCQDIILKAISVGSIEELKQQDYKGKRVFIEISDTFGNKIPSKIDLGVHTKLDIKQEEFCFDIAFDEDIFGMYYLCGHINRKKDI